VKSIDDYTTANATVVETGIKSAIVSIPPIDYTANGSVTISDFTTFANYYRVRTEVTPSTSEYYVGAFDLNGSGSISIADFTSFASTYRTTVSAKGIAGDELPSSSIPLAIGADFDNSTSMYHVSVNIGQPETIQGFEFLMSYNPSAVEFIENSQTGLAGLDIVYKVEDGLVRVASAFPGDAFEGTLTLGFRSLGTAGNMTFEIADARVVDLAGVEALTTNIVNYMQKAIPTVYSLSQNFPNPFNPTTTISYSLPEAGNVELVIYNMAGQKVRTLVNSRQDASFYQIVWDGRNDSGSSVASGLYFYKLTAGHFSKIQKMTLVK